MCILPKQGLVFGKLMGLIMLLLCSAAISQASALTLTGTISLPNSDTASNGAINTRIIIDRYDANQGFLGRVLEDVTIASDESSQVYSVMSDDAPADGFYTVLFSCSSNCDPYLNSSRYLQTDGAVNFGFTYLTPAQVPTSMDFELIEGLLLTGSVSLPGSELAGASQIGATVRVVTFDAVGDFITSVQTFQDISTGENEAEYSLRYLAAPAGGSYQVSYRCSGSCGTYLTTEQYLLDDGSFTFDSQSAFIDPANLASPVNVELVQGEALSGSISLPTGDPVAANNIGTRLEVNTFRADGSFLANIVSFQTIPSGESSVDYEIGYLLPPAGGYNEISYRCSSGCGDYLTSPEFLQADGSFEFSRAQLNPAQVSPSVDYELKTGLNLSGDINLPDGDTAAANIRVFVSVQVYTSDNVLLASTSSSPTIAQNTSSVPYSLNFPPAPNDGYYFVSIACSTNCEGYLTNSIYLQNDGSTAFIRNQLASANLPTTSDFELQEPATIDGLIRLPDGQTADQGIIGVTLNVATFTADEQFVSSVNTDIAIPADDSSAQFSANYVEASDGGYYEVNVRCNSNCGIYLTSSFFLQDDGSFSLEFNELQPVNLPASLEFELEQGSVLSGTIGLPDGALADGAIDTRVEIRTLDENSNTVDSVNVFISIPNGQNSTEFSRTYTPAPENGSYEISFFCSGNNCGLYNTSRLYLLDDGSSSQFRTSIAADSVPTNVDLELLENISLNGTIFLPEGDIADDGDIEVLIRAFRRTGDNTSLGSTSKRVVIPSGQSSVEYDFGFLPVPAGGNYQINFFCVENCGNYLTSSSYLYPDGSTDFQSVQIPEDQLPAAADFTLIEGSLLPGSISLPEGANAVDDIRSSVRVEVYDSGNNFITSVQQNVTILTGQNSVSFTLPYFAGPADTLYVVSTSCDSNCADFVQSERYVQSDGTLSPSFTRISAAMIPSTFDIELSEGFVISGTISLPDSQVASDGLMSVQVVVSTYDASGAFISNQFVTERIRDGEASTSFRVVYIEAPAGGSYDLRYNCFSNCGIYTIGNVYINADGSREFSRVSIPEDQFPAMADIEMLPGLLIEGSVSLPNGDLAESDVRTRITAQAFNQSSQFLSSRGTNVTILAGQNSSDYSLVAVPVGDGFYRFLYNCNENCDPYETNTRYLQVDGSSDYQVDDIGPTVLTPPIDLELLLGLQPDIYEDDDDDTTASSIRPGETQNRSIHIPGNIDWVSFEVGPETTDVRLRALADETSGAPLMRLFNDDFNQIDRSDSELDEDELMNMHLSTINLDELPEGTYFLRIDSFDFISRVDSYTLRLSLRSPATDELCIPVKTTGGSIAVICI